MHMLAERFNGGDMRAVLGSVLAALMAAPAVVSGQWFNYATEGLPRNPDGTLNRRAPAPRLPDGHPDLSGIWHAANPTRCNGQFVQCGNEIGGSLLGGNLGRDFPGGSLPYRPEAATLAAARHADDSRDDPHVRCLPDNPPRAWTLPHLTKIMQTPKQLALLYEVNAMYRQIFTDGRPLPDDPTPGWMGYSTARWEGDTLIIQTTGFRDDLWMDLGGTPMSDATKLTERLRRPNYGSLEIEITVEDPKVFTKPWTVRMDQSIELDTDLIDEFCLENEKSYDRMIRSRGK
jgi:hypothetical protein